MKLNCCCFSCICGEDKNEKNSEVSKLLDNNIENEDSQKQEEDQLIKDQNLPEKEEKDKKHKMKEKLKRISLLSRIASSSYLDHRPLGLNVELKIDFKIFPNSESVKIFAVSAYGISTSLLEDVETTDQPESDSISLQLRTKITPPDIRGHSKKYHLKDNYLDSIKFSNECIHDLNFYVFRDSNFRLRLYRLHKQRRDQLLGEFTLILNDLEIRLTESGTTTVSMCLHDIGASVIQPPKIKKVLIDPHSSRRKTIRRSDSKSSRKSFNISSEGFRNRIFSDSVPEVEETQARSQSLRSVPQDTFTMIHSAFKERLDRVNELEETTNEMKENANSFQAVSQHLAEKYKKKSQNK